MMDCYAYRIDPDRRRNFALIVQEEITAGPGSAKKN